MRATQLWVEPRLRVLILVLFRFQLDLTSGFLDCELRLKLCLHVFKFGLELGLFLGGLGVDVFLDLLLTSLVLLAVQMVLELGTDIVPILEEGRFCSGLLQRRLDSILGIMLEVDEEDLMRAWCAGRTSSWLQFVGVPKEAFQLRAAGLGTMPAQRVSLTVRTWIARSSRIANAPGATSR